CCSVQQDAFPASARLALIAGTKNALERRRVEAKRKLAEDCPGWNCSRRRDRAARTVRHPAFTRTPDRQDAEPFELSVLHHNFRILFLGLALTWTLAAFGEEMVYRGYLMNRVVELGHNSRVAWAVSLVLVKWGSCTSEEGAVWRLP